MRDEGPAARCMEAATPLYRKAESDGTWHRNMLYGVGACIPKPQKEEEVNETPEVRIISLLPITYLAWSGAAYRSLHEWMSLVLPN